MMHRSVKSIAAAVLVAAAASPAAAQTMMTPGRPFSLGISGGASVPTGDLSSIANTGYNITGILGLNPVAFPLGIRVEGGYNSFGVKNNTCTGGDPSIAAKCDLRVLSLTGNLVYALPLQGTMIRPYVIGGAGLYNLKASASTTSSGISASASQSENEFGFNVGGGIIIPLSGFNTFIEARYTRVSLGDNFNSNSDIAAFPIGSTAQFVPIKFGIMF